MIAKMLFLLTAIFLQELVVLNAFIVMVHTGAYPAIGIFILFIIATAVDIIIGFYIGHYFSKKTATSKFHRYIKKQSESFSFSQGSPKRWLTLLVLGNISFCYINAVIAGYLELPFWESQAYNFFGNILSYIFLWYAIGGVNTFFRNPFITTITIVVASFALLVLFEKLSTIRIHK